MAYPIVVAVVAFSFAAIVVRQFGQKRKPHLLVWGISLTLGGIAALAFVLFLADNRNVALFRLYYVCGALLMAAYLGLGSVYLLAPRRTAHIVAAVLVAVSAVGLILVMLAPIDAARLQGSNVEAGTQALSGPAIAAVALLNTFGAAAVIGGALYSAWRLWSRQGPPRLLVANILIATGTILASLAGTLARVTGNGSSFWALLAVGFVVLFGGFLCTSVRRLPLLREESRSAQTTA